MDETKGREVYALLDEAERYGIGLMFEPDYDEEGEPNGWTINYVIHDWPAVQGQTADYPGDRLSSAYDLQTAVAAAMKPLAEMGGRLSGHMQRRYSESKEAH